ncbi:hypothetical protein BJ322DRAFT_1017864 [Thelephora terrestris]|uniref:Uncharacterized protein n=1 Tax=Thelephora terrestris TaxID=56493 RepID=A0A9P6L993_9AGAM|nr:hypothetical protein BJ322DRAFT_1017864 [Thelephora terrestris]
MSEGSLESPTGHAIMKAVRASLRLASGSMELLTISQLLTVKGDLYETLTIFNKRVQAMESEDQSLIVNMSDSETTSDEDEQNNGNMSSSAEQEQQDTPPGPDSCPADEGVADEKSAE